MQPLEKMGKLGSLSYCRTALLATLTLLSFSAWAQPGPEWAHAYDLYQATNYEGSLAVLSSPSPNDAAALQLKGQNHFMMGDYKQASEALESACNLTPHSSVCWNWLGRAYGRRAETGNPITAPGNASKARQYFERAVQLDPANREAAGDLFDYYLEAPGFLGGGEQKAEALAAKMAGRDAAEAHYYRALIAERHKQYDTAEQHFRTALEIAPKQVGHLINLASFLAVRGRHKESDALFEEAAKIAPANPRVPFERASAYIKTMRNLGEARRLLQEYMRSPLTPNDPPKTEAEALLKKIGA